MTPRNSSPRRRGAPLGNTNALKHGFYSRRFRKSEIDDLESTTFTGLRDEIAMLRVCIRRIIEWGIQIQDFPEALSFLRVISLATASLSRLVRTQDAIAGTKIEEVLQKAVEEVAAELGITAPPQGGTPPDQTSTDEFVLDYFNEEQSKS